MSDLADHRVVTLHASEAAVQCIVIGPVCLFMGVWVCVFVGLLPRELEIVCINPHQTEFVSKGSDHLQLIKFWPSRAPGKGICGGNTQTNPQTGAITMRH